jgi:hypothetical protein
VEVLPNVELSSITIRHADGTLATVAPTDELLVRVDARQYELREGPCYYAATTDEHVISSDLGADERFPRYGAMAVAEGLRAQVGVRLFDSPRGNGALNLYSRRVGAFDDLHSLSALFAHQAAQAIAYAHEIEGLGEAVRTRTTIGQERAFAFLQRLSSHRNVKLRLVAKELVDDVAARPGQDH